jgi:imidazolonepropionase-like amidohydrolase
VTVSRALVSGALVLAGTVVCADLQGHAQSGRPAAGALALVGGTVYLNPTADPIANGTVLIQSGRIAAVGPRQSVRLPPDAQVVDCTGLTVTAGFWNSHAHFLQRKWTNAATLPAPELERQLEGMLTQYGVTSVFDTWSMWENTKKIRERIEAGEVRGPRIRSTGEAMFGPGPAVPAAAWASLGFMNLEGFKLTPVAEPADALATTKALLDAGADAVKFYAATPGTNPRVVSQAAMEEGVREAHRRGKLAFSHPSSDVGLLASERAAVADRFLTTAIEQLRTWVNAGGDVLFGTDVGYMSEYDPTDEYVFMSQAGMSLRQILASLTTAPAARFADSARLGRIEAGLVADLTVVRGDPARDIRALADVQYVVRDGAVIYRSARR